MIQTVPDSVKAQQLCESLSKEASRIEEDCIHSAKSHFNAADCWRNRHYWFGVPATMLGAAAGAAIVKDWPEAAQILSLAATILTGLLTFLKPGEQAAQHKTVADQYLALKNDTRVFREVDLLQVEGTSELAEMLRTLSQRRNELNQGSPEIPRAAFVNARRGIEEGEANYQVDRKE